MLACLQHPVLDCLCQCLGELSALFGLYPWFLFGAEAMLSFGTVLTVASSSCAAASVYWWAHGVIKLEGSRECLPTACTQIPCGVVRTSLWTLSTLITGKRLFSHLTGSTRLPGCLSSLHHPGIWKWVQAEGNSFTACLFAAIRSKHIHSLFLG